MTPPPLPPKTIGWPTFAVAVLVGLIPTALIVLAITVILLTPRSPTP